MGTTAFAGKRGLTMRLQLMHPLVQMVAQRKKAAGGQ